MKVKTPRNSYHHKNLKDEILKASREFIESNGHDSLSLRNIASSIGVAHTAIYHHYKNKNDLLADVAAGEFEIFVNQVKEKNRVDKNEDKPYIQLFNYGNAYIEYALEHGNIFRLMLGRHPFNLEDYPRLVDLSAEALRYLVELVEKCQQAGIIKKGDSLKISLGIWSMSHGLATLLIDNRIDTLGIYGFQQDFTAHDLTEYIFDILKNGLLVETKKFF
jgi:AcrR family transcriptional regulator